VCLNARAVVEELANRLAAVFVPTVTNWTTRPETVCPNVQRVVPMAFAFCPIIASATQDTRWMPPPRSACPPALITASRPMASVRRPTDASAIQVTFPSQTPSRLRVNRSAKMAAKMEFVALPMSVNAIDSTERIPIKTAPRSVTANV